MKKKKKDEFLKKFYECSSIMEQTKKINNFTMTKTKQFFLTTSKKQYICMY